MKTRKLAFFGLGAILLSAASCSNDNIMSEPNQPLEKAQSFYIPISVNGFQGNSGTRALTEDGDYTYNPTDDPNFNKGTDAENKVQEVYLVFYDALGKKVAHTGALTNLNQTLGAANPGNENALYTGVVQVNVQEGKNIPSYVLAFVNPYDISDLTSDDSDDPDKDFATLANVEKATRESFITEDDNNFAMSNSVYYGTDAFTGTPNVRIMATPIETGKIFKSRQEAEDAIADTENPGSSCVDIYVERYAGKVNFSLGNESGVEIAAVPMKDIEGNDVSIKFVPEVWAVNAVEEKSYVTKNFFGQIADGETFDFTQPATYTQMNTALKDWKWNNPDYCRSYWGQSPGYYIARYPRVADDILDNRTDKDDSDDKGGFELKYYSYEEMTNGKGTALTDIARGINADGTSTAIYTRENTVSGQALKDAKADPFASPKAAIASVVMIGSYQVARGTGNTNYAPYPEDETFYVTGNATNGYTFYNEEQMTNFFINNTIRLAKDANGTPFFNYKEAAAVKDAGFIPADATEYAEYFEIEHPSAGVRGSLVMDSRYVTLQLTSKAAGKIYAKIGDQYQAVTAANIDAINRQIMNVAGTAYGYNSGKAYFNIPIQHLGYQRSSNLNKSLAKGANDPAFKWENTQSGDFGVVRNHIYTINATKINGLGNAIPHPEDPIVPPADPEEYYIGARIIVLNWAVVPTQSVEL